MDVFRARPGARLRQVVLAGAMSALLVSCASSGAVPRPFPGAALPPGSDTPPRAEAPARPVAPGTAATPTAPDTAVVTDPARDALVATALSYRGTPYRNGGSDPSGFDCSGFVQFVFNQHATRLPRDVYEQSMVGAPIGLRDVRPGDLIFFQTERRGPSHVGVAIGGDAFVHAPSSRGVVRVERFTAPYWSMRLVGARRVITPASGDVH